MALTIPAFLEDRGTIKVDPATNSTVNKPQVYCKDLLGCGERLYEVRTISSQINQAVNCNIQPQLIGTIKIIRDAAGSDAVTADEIIDFVQFLMEELLATFNLTACSATDNEFGTPDPGEITGPNP